MIALDSRRGASFAREAFDDDRVLQHRRQEKFDCDALVEGEVLRPDDDTHAALTQDSVNPVFAPDHTA
jgi:hypothetical protein